MAIESLPYMSSMAGDITITAPYGAIAQSAYESSARGAGESTNIVGTSYSKIKPTQEAVNSQKVMDYANRLNAGEKLPAIEVVDVPGKGLYIIEGHHRYVASQQTGIPVDIKVIQSQGPIGMPDWSEVQWRDYINESQFWGE